MAEYQIALSEETIKALNIAEDEEVLELICEDVKTEDGALFRYRVCDGVGALRYRAFSAAAVSRLACA